MIHLNLSYFWGQHHQRHFQSDLQTLRGTSRHCIFSSHGQVAVQVMSEQEGLKAALLLLVEAYETGDVARDVIQTLHQLLPFSQYCRYDGAFSVRQSSQ